MIVIEATFCQLSEPPETVGAVGSVRSMRAVEPAVAEAGVQAEVLPALSMLRYWTSVSPSAVTFTEAPAVALDQDDAAVGRGAVLVARQPGVAAGGARAGDGDARHVLPATASRPRRSARSGSVRSMRAVEPAVAEAGRPGAEVLPALSMLRYCTSVSPSAVMFTEAPAVALASSMPPSVELRYS